MTLPFRSRRRRDRGSAEPTPCVFAVVLALVLAACGGSVGPNPAGASPGDGGGGTGAADAFVDEHPHDAAHEIRVFTGEPSNCTTVGGLPGITVDVFPYPGPQPQCEPLNQPGVEATDCPKDSLYECGLSDCAPVEAMVGCCRPDGYCGLLERGHWGKDLALGCIARDSWIANQQWLDENLAPARCGD